MTDITFYQKKLEISELMNQQVFSQNIFDLIDAKAVSMVNQVEF